MMMRMAFQMQMKLSTELIHFYLILTEMDYLMAKKL